MANIYNEPESTDVIITLKNNVYSYLNTHIGIAKMCLITDQKKFGYSDLNGNLKKCLTDASGSSVTPENCVFIADSEGSASHSTTFVYNDNKLGVNIAAPQNKAHFHEPSTGNCLIQITNASRGSSDDNDGMTVGIVGDDNVIRTSYDIPVKIQVEDNDNPGTFVDLATFQNTGWHSNTILDTDLTVGVIPAKSTAASVFLTHEENTIKTRTADQVLDDIGAAAVSHTHATADITSGTLDNARLSFNPDHFVQGTNNRRMILSNSTSPLASTEYSTFFRMDNTDPSFDSRLTGGVGLGLKVINNSPSLGSFELMGQAHGNGVILFGGVDNEGNRYPWKSIWHGGNFNPADYQPEITGTENKVLSIQAGGTGVKTGSISDNGTTGFFGNGFVGQYESDVKHYHDVLAYNRPEASITGIMKIVMPKSWSNTMLTFTIKGYNYNYVTGQGAWECIISGYNYLTTNEWRNCSAEIRGFAPFSQVRLVHDGTKCCLLLGNTSTTWSYPQVAITEVFASYVNTSGWETGWSASIITSEDGLTKIVTPTVNSGVSADWDALINKPSTFAPAAHNHTASHLPGNIVYTDNAQTISGVKTFNANTAFGKNTFVGGYKVEVEGNTLVNGTLKANDFGDDWVDYSSSIQFEGFSATGLTKKVYYKKEGKRITIVFYFNGTCNGYYFTLNHTPIGNIKSEHMLADKSLYTGILHYNDFEGYMNGFASTIVENWNGEIRIRAITSDGNMFPSDSDGHSLIIRGSFTYYTD